MASGLVRVGILILVVWTPPGIGGTGSELAGFADEVERIRGAWEVPGMAVGAVRDGEVVFLQGFGVRELTSGEPVTSRTLFAIGSCSKAFAATSVMIAAERGLLDFDAPVADVLPCFRLADEYATLHATARDLLSHRTGVPGDYDILYLPVLARFSRDELCRRARYLKPTAELRERYQYNSLMVVHAAHMIEVATGATWEEFLDRHLLEPLGMRRTDASVAAMIADGDYAVPYLESDDGPVPAPQYELAVAAPAGGLNSSVEEMVRWLLFNLGDGTWDGRRLISANGLGELHTPQMVNPHSNLMGPDAQYALGWQVTDHRGHRHLEHGGHIGGYSAWVGLLPDDGIGVVVLSNRSFQTAINVVMREAYDLLLGLEPYDWRSHFRSLERRVNGSDEVAESEPSPAISGPRSLPLAAYAGSYDHPAFGTMAIREGTDGLEGELLGQSFGMDHLRFDVFAGRGETLSGRTMRFELGDDGRVVAVSVLWSSDVPRLRFERVPSLQ